MHAENALVVQIGRRFADGSIEPIRLGPIDRIEEHGTEDPFAELGAFDRGHIVRQQLGSDIPEFPLARPEEEIDRGLIERSYVAAELLGVNDIATDKMLIRRASAPLQIEEVVATERERPQ
jgi:hypothetical protein